MGSTLFIKCLRNWRILGALTFSVLLMAGAYVLAKGVLTAPHASASEESELLKQIASRDTDGDALPDWEEGLYGTDPQVTDSNNLGMTDGEAVSRGLIVPKALVNAPAPAPATGVDVSDIDPSLPPAPAEGTLTATFTQYFFNLYLAAKQAKGGAELSADEMQSIADEALAALSTALVTAPDFKSKGDLKIAGSGAAALIDFAARAEAVLMANTSTASTSEVNYLKSAVTQNDPLAFFQLDSIAKTYRTMAIGLAALEVPLELADTHLALVNSMMRISEIINDFGRVNTDPVAAMFALQQYPKAVVDMGTAFLNIRTAYINAGVVLPKDAPGALFVGVIDTVPSGPAPTL